MQIFARAMENVRNIEILDKFVTTESRGNYLESESNYHTTKCSTRKCISNRNEKI